MNLVAKKKLLFFLGDENGLIYYVDNGIVKKKALPTWVRHDPDGWKDITLQFATNLKYFSTLRTFSNAIRFVEDGEQIIADRAINGKGADEIMDLIILNNDPSGGLNYYKLEYKSRLDFSKFDGDTRKGIGMNTLQDDVFALIQANETNNYSIPCNSSNPKAIKVLFDGTLLQDKLNYNVLNVPIILNSANAYFIVPFSFINNEGDSVGAIFQSQTYENFADPFTHLADPTNNNNAISFTEATTVFAKGTFSFSWKTDTLPPGGFAAWFVRSNHVGTDLTQWYEIFNIGDGTILDDHPSYVVNINFTIPLEANEKLFFIVALSDNAARNFTIIPDQTLISFNFATKQVPSVAYGLRGIDYLQQFVSLVSQGKFTADSNFLRSNNRKIILSGSSLRSFPDAQIYSNFSDFFKSFSACYNLGVTVRNGVLFIEPIEDIYNSKKELMNLGQISEVKLNFAEAYMFTAAKFGYIKQTYNKRNGRYEYNCTHSYKFPINTVLNQLDKVSPYRADSFGMEFIRTGYPDLNTTDDKGDHDIFTVMISDEVGSTDGEVSTAISFTVETLILAAPIIKRPFSGITVYSQHPTIRGIAQPSKLITIYVDGVIDGTTNSDANGDWSYTIAATLDSVSTIFNGTHFISANAQTDPGNISGFSNIISLIINTMITAPFIITAPTNNDTLFDNLPLIEGIAPPGTNITLKIDGVTLTTVIADGSGDWLFQIVVPLTDAVHIITAIATGLPDAPAVNITVNKNVSSPLITSIKYGDVIFNNLPLIKGVAIPTTVVPIYLDGGGGAIADPTNPLGTAVADANGDWQFQVTTFIDPSSGLSFPRLPEGLHILSTTPTPINILIAISGYKLMRGINKGSAMDYDSIRLDDQYIPPGVDPATLPPTLGQFLHPETLYNIEETSPLRMLLAHANVLGSFLIQHPDEQIIFNGAEANANLVTKKNGVVLNEGANVDISSFVGPLYIPFMLNFKARVPKTFNEIMTSINNDGYITTEFKGTTIYCLPVGNMSMKPATNEAQQFKLLVSGKTPLISLIKLFSKGLTINLGLNMLYLSNKNPLHFVKYNYDLPPQYHMKDIYDDWQKNRVQNFLAQPDYVQPFQKTEQIPLQLISNGVDVITLKMYSCITATVVDTFVFNTVAGTPVALPNLLQECNIDLSAYPEDDYWFVMLAGATIIAISEKITTQNDCPKTLLFEYDGSEDTIDYYFSSGIKPQLRFEGVLMPWIPDSDIDTYEDEYKDPVITDGRIGKKKTLFFGNGQNLLPDWAILKLDAITQLSKVRLEGVQISRTKDAKIEAVEQGQGFPNYLYKLDITLADNQNGATFGTPSDDPTHTTVWVLDATAFGPQPGVINVTADQE